MTTIDQKMMMHIQEDIMANLLKTRYKCMYTKRKDEL